LELFGLELIPPSEFGIRLPAEILAQFESVSGLLIVNTSYERWIEVFSRRKGDAHFTVDDSGRQLISAINHETYHYFQTIGTGYMLSRSWKMRSLAAKQIGTLVNREFFRELRARLVHAAGLLVFGWTKPHRDWWSRLGSALLEIDRVGRRKSTMTPGDASWAMATYPELFRQLRAIDEEMDEQTPVGLSTRSVIEASALFYEHALENGGEGLHSRFEADLAYYDATYRRAYEVAKEACGRRAVEIVLPASALALRYSRPAEAFPYFVERLGAGDERDGLDAARRLGEQLPDIPLAGERLGTACEFRRSNAMRHEKAGIYDEQLKLLGDRAWGVDEISLLSDPPASFLVPSFALGIALRDRAIPGFLSLADLTGRLTLANIVLRRTSLPRRERDAIRQFWEATPHLTSLFMTSEEPDLDDTSAQ
jgi:hypothetical protein